tara:strand:+ start:202 stop:441 length:240 start_codon:yes stop_codon:yes gene_type:complete
MRTSSKKSSLLEAMTDVGCGFAMYLPINFFLLPLFSEGIASHDIVSFLEISLIFTCIALVRKYVIRRFFARVESCVEKS